LAGLVHRETGKPADDALLEIMLAAEHLDWAARKEAKVLSPRRVPSGPPMLNQAASLSYVPLGVVGLIGPWNYPVFAPMESIAYALAAGNAVVFKPSEYTPGVGGWLAENFASAVGEAALFSVVTGDAARAACCPEPGWTSSPLRDGAHRPRGDGGLRGDARADAAECGGKDALIVAADVDAAAQAALWGGLSNAGQTCVGVERVYVADAVHDEFLARLVALAPAIRPGADEQASYGPITMPAQVELIRRHIRRRPGAWCAGGRRRPGRRLRRLRGPGGADRRTRGRARPARGDLRADADRRPGCAMAGGVDRAYDSAYALASAVLSRRRGTQLARRLRVGMTSVNASHRLRRGAVPAASASPASAASTAPTACASSPAPRPSRASASHPRWI